jgi:SnoaL-like domain
MDAVSDELKDLLAREKIRACVARIARGEDRREASSLGACYWPDAKVDFGVFSGTFAEYLAWVVPGSPAVLLTQHVLGQSVIELEPERVRASSETHVLSYHRIDMGTSQRDMVLGGRYLDALEKRGAQWRIATRTMLYDWVQVFGDSADWSQGLLGTPFSAGHFPGKAVGDFSETFFGHDKRKR